MIKVYRTHCDVRGFDYQVIRDSALAIRYDVSPFRQHHSALGEIAEIACLYQLS